MPQESETAPGKLVESQVSESTRKREEPKPPVRPPLRGNLFTRWPRRLLVATLLFIVLVVGIVGIVGLFGVGLLGSGTKTPFTLAMSTSLTGSEAGQSHEALQGVQLYLDAVNRTGGVHGHPVQLQVFDDKDDPATAQQVAHQVIASPALLLLGPLWSTLAVPTNPIYREAHLPLINASATNDSITHDNPYLFRLITDNTQEGIMAASYAFQILGFRTASIVYATDTVFSTPVGMAFASTFASAGGVVAHRLPLAQDLQQRQQALESIVTTLAHDRKPGIIFISMYEQDARQVIVALRRGGITAPIMGNDAESNTLFAASFASYPEESRQPGYFTDGMYAPTPLLYDSSPSEAQAFSTLYQHTYGTLPDWIAATYYDAAQVAVATLQAAAIGGTSASLSSDRAQIAERLGTMTSPQASVEGLDGLLYFDRTRNGAGTTMRFGQFSHRGFFSAPLQLVPVSNLTVVDVPKEERAGTLIEVGTRYFWKQRVVYSGIDLNSVSNIDQTNSIFTADFFLWMRYSGSDDATAITFTNGSSVSFDPSMPLSDQTIDGLHYRLYHVTGDFKADYDFHDYPFDQQHLVISFQNTHLTSERLVYAIDAPGLRLRADNTADPTTMAAVFQALSSWTYVSTQYASDTFTSHSTVGDPRNFGQRTQTAYSGLQVTTTLQRKSLSYLIGHLIPLLLLFLLVYASLYLHLDHLGDRLGLIVTSLLASAVLLLSLNGELPAIGYAVSLDYIYYVFFVLCLVCIGITLLMEWFGRNGKRPEMVDRSNVFLHTIYLTTLILTITSYVVIYHDRLA